MTKGRKEAKMDNNLQPYSGEDYSDMNRESKNLLDEELAKKKKLTIVWEDFREELQKEDMLSFMETFNFPSLSNLRSSLKASGQYTKEQLDEIVAGLKDLPEYRD